eukprot:CAMPEP_0168775716 /NCGR_PEP_ID=MMETSP0725-20121227/5657_1 /TAXON_ID=265536 /ORGANISM="Amphiprora sp., Strain CCMP467" /LENGTH=946 /DNA_ID=CAMNT_0008825357 /DNA_START=81 /DNA_END=2921 /DNA_ORIENTATION=+
MPRFALLDDDVDSDNDNGHEPPHPLGFDHQHDSPVGDDDDRPEIGLYSSGQSRYCFDEDADEDAPFFPWSNEPPIGQSTQQALLSTRVNTETTPMKTLLKYAHLDASASRKKAHQEQGLLLSPPPDSVQSYSDALTDLAERLSQLDYHGGSQENRLPPTTLEPFSLPAEYAQVGEKEQRIQRSMVRVQQKFQAKQEERRRNIQVLIDQEQAESNRRLEKQRRHEEEAEAQRVAQVKERQEAARQAQDERDRRAADEAKQQEKLDAQRAQEQAQRDEAQAAEQRVADAARAATEYLRRAEKFVAQLKQLRASVEPFDKSKPMAKRRLGMKKVVNGKINTLSEDIDKIRSVAQDVSAAIAQARQEDGQIEDMIKNGNTEYTKDMAKGKRYFVDLLCSKVIVRVQAEGFNGQRGDGFPLAHMLAIVAAEHKDIGAVLAAHVYTVCPTAIPRLPSISKNATEEELMESLGMIKDKSGNYETFERFLGRTEGLISMVANIMSSEPSDHQLFGGNAGAVKWLSRFLSALPNSSPLPLITAPVLDAFLTGAGHMLALAYPEDFQKHLKTIVDDVMPKLDEGAIGKPSATRLAKTISGGFESFKDKLPSRAIGELYHGSTTSGFQKELSSAPKNSANYQPPKERKKKNPQQQAVAGPFGGGQQQQQGGPFGGGQQQQQQGGPFGQSQGSGAPATSPFGQAPAPAQSPFGQASAPSQSPFGQSNNTSSFGGQGMSSFGSDQPDSMASDSAATFGNTTATSPSPFNTQSSSGAPGPFGSANPPTGNAYGAPSPFGSTSATPAFGQSSTTPAPSGFGAPASSGFGIAPAPSPFNTNNNAPFGGNSNNNSSPFGAGGGPSPFSAAPSSSPFSGGGGGFGGGQNQGGFGGQGGGSFGGQNQGGFGGQGGGGRGGNKPPCKFFAKGQCRYGNNCKFSHDIGGGGSGGNNFSSPFSGGPRR